MPSLITDPSFYLVAIPAVVLVGLAKGGLGGAMGFLGVPLMALVISPVQAAAILLPILVLMDVVSLWSWRGYYDRRTLAIMLPGALLGIGIGWLTATLVTGDMVRLVLGVVTLLFVARWLYSMVAGTGQASTHNPPAGVFWGAVSGFTSFVAHAGGPPYQVYTLPLRYDPKLYTGTSVIYFSVVNAVKLVPYFALGQFDAVNLGTSLALLPFAPLATLAGAYVVKRMRAEVFYPLAYATVFVVALKLLWDGVSAFSG
ncbi:MAG: sulfite exporter TauE/SafE family protein [Nitratireductor sp.]|jgi:hypothetical protein